MKQERMIAGFALEGECYVGKSSTLREIAVTAKRLGQDICVVPEYFEIGSLSSTSRRDVVDTKRIQDEIIDLERRRTELATNRLARNPELILGFDRSFLTCVAFELAKRRCGELDGLDYLMERYIQEFQQGNLLLPAQVIHLVAEPAEILKRRRNHLEKGHRDVSEFLRKPLVVQIHNDFYTQAGTGIFAGSYMRLPVGNKSLEEISEEVLTWIHTGTGIYNFDINKIYEIIA